VGGQPAPRVVATVPLRRSGHGAGRCSPRAHWAGRAGGVPPLPDQPGPLQPVSGPASGLRVQLLAAEAPQVPLAEQPPMPRGKPPSRCPPGRYWVLVPGADALPGLPGAQASGAYLPDEVAPAETTAERCRCPRRL